MEILVGDLSKLYGISNQTLHYYEKKKILKSRRDPLNGYRYYEPTDLNRLGSIKKYRNAKFNLEEVVSIVEDSSIWDIVNQYAKQKKSLQNEIEILQQIIHRMDDDLNLYMRYCELGREIIEEDLEGFLIFESEKTKIVFQEQKMRTEAIPWFKNILHTCASKMYTLSDEGKILHSSYGMLATKEVAKYLELKITKNVKEINDGLFVTLMINKEYNDGFEESVYDCLNYINENNLRIRGNPFTKTIFVHKDNSRKERILLVQILIPVSKA